MITRLLSYPVFIVWAVINLCAGIWEIYAYLHRTQLKLEYTTLWEKLAKGEITIKNFWIEGWSEYCKVDSRYKNKFFQGGYVWGFELLNAYLAIIFIFALAFNYIYIVRIILLIGIINCLGYFSTLALEIVACRIDNRVSKWWQYPTYYTISGIWLLVPWYLWEIVSSF